MPDAPFFPAWRARFSRRPATTLAATYAGLRRCTLHQLEARFLPFLAGVTGVAPASATTRERPYAVRRTWWCFLWQVFERNVSCRDVVRQLQAMFVLEGRPGVDEGTSAYCQARARLPDDLLTAALQASAQAATARVAPSTALQGRAVKMLDGTTLVLPDTPLNQAEYPQSKSQKPGCGFPLLNLLAVWDARGATIGDVELGNQHHSELRLLHQLAPRLAPQDIVVYDRALGHYVGCALLRARDLDLISRVHTRRIDWRRGQRLGRNERLVTWRKSRCQPPYLTTAEWAALPDEITVRLIRVRVQQKGFRTRELQLVTTLLDAVAYPAAEIIEAYRRRWRLEMCLDDLKTTLDLDALRCQSPALVRRELLMLLTAHNLVRAVMAEAAATHAVPLDRLSFTGTLVTLRSFCAAHAQTARPHLRRLLWLEMLRIIAADQLPLRPGRWAPRAVKRRPKSYPRLNRPRHEYRQARHGSVYRRPART
jgi:hypothetical protein